MSLSSNIVYIYLFKYYSNTIQILFILFVSLINNKIEFYVILFKYSIINTIFTTMSKSNSNSYSYILKNISIIWQSPTSLNLKTTRLTGNIIHTLCASVKIEKTKHPRYINTCMLGHAVAREANDI